MKKLLIFSLLLIISCGLSEEEIQASIDEAAEQATSTSSTISSSTTSISSTLPLSTSSTSSTTTSSSSTSTTTTTTSSTTETTITTTLNLITYTEPSVASDSIEICKIKEASQTRGFTWAGFPQLTPLTKTTGTVKWALLPVDFADLPGDASWRLRLELETQFLSEWVDTVSEGKLKVEWVIAESWIRMPGLSSDYSITKERGINNTPGGIEFFQSAMYAADPFFDFTDIQTVNIVLPTNQEIAKVGENGFPWDQHVKDLVTNEGSISSFTISGQYHTRPDAYLWAYWFHEFGHAIGLAHIGNGGPEVPPFNEWDILGSQDGASLELSGWMRFLAGWMQDERVYCKDSKSISNIDLTLVPLSKSDDGIKFAIFPLSSTKALLVESRRVTKFSCTTPTPRDGVLVYLLDLSLGHSQDFLVPINPPNRTVVERSTCNGNLSIPSLDILLHEGDKITYEGISIEVIMQRNYDNIVISK